LLTEAIKLNFLLTISNIMAKEIEIIQRLFLVIAMYCQARSSQFNESLNLTHRYWVEKNPSYMQ
jgi:hypothetical protein